MNQQYFYIAVYVGLVASYFEILVFEVAFEPYVGTFQNCFDVFLILQLIWQKKAC
jgi:hypothetical protein